MKTNDKYTYPYISKHPWACTTHRTCHRGRGKLRKGKLEVEVRCRRIQVLGTQAHGEDNVRKDRSRLRHSGTKLGRSFPQLMKRGRKRREKGRRRSTIMATGTARVTPTVRLRDEDAVTRVPHLPLDNERGAAATAAPARVNQPHKADGRRW